MKATAEPFTGLAKVILGTGVCAVLLTGCMGFLFPSDPALIDESVRGPLADTCAEFSWSIQPFELNVRLKEDLADAAEFALTWQLEHGGWSKNKPTLERAWDGKENKHEQTGKNGLPLGSFDNNATVAELWVLARAYRETGDERFRQSFNRGLDFVFEAQHPSGGWPQVYPERTGSPTGGLYSNYVTFNDHAMTRVLLLLRDIARGEPPYDWISPDLQQQAAEAFRAGIDYILAAQIIVNGRPTAWGQQHDPNSPFGPLHGRPYELPGIAADESAGLARLLMSLDERDGVPLEDVRQAVNCALDWFSASRLEKPLAAAHRSGRWARLYWLEDGLTPIFGDRDSGGQKIYWDVNEISEERRSGYAWAGDWPQDLLDSVTRIEP